MDHADLSYKTDQWQLTYQLFMTNQLEPSSIIPDSFSRDIFCYYAMCFLFFVILLFALMRSRTTSTAKECFCLFLALKGIEPSSHDIINRLRRVAVSIFCVIVLTVWLEQLHNYIVFIFKWTLSNNMQRLIWTKNIQNVKQMHPLDSNANKIIT